MCRCVFYLLARGFLNECYQEYGEAVPLIEYTSMPEPHHSQVRRAISLIPTIELGASAPPR